VPVVQGEFERANLCRLIGTIDLFVETGGSVLPAGSPVDVTLAIDRSGNLTATARVPQVDRTFEGKLLLVAPSASAAELASALPALRAAAERLYVDPLLDDASRAKLQAIDALLDGADAELDAARGGDADALEKLRRLVLEVEGGMAEVEAQKAWPKLELEALETIAFATSQLQVSGTATEQRALDEAMRGLERARTARNPADFGRRLRAIEGLAHAAAWRDDACVAQYFREYAGRIGECRDIRAAQRHVADGEAAMGRGDVTALRKAALALSALFPPDEEVRAKAHGSGVES
jgi:molecular chaperone DnaK